MGDRARSGPHGQLDRREEGPRHRDDGGAQRVRDGRELAPSACCRARARDRVPAGTTTATRRSATAPTSRTCRSTAAGVLPRILPARQRGAGRRGQVRRGQDARADQHELSARFRSPRASWSRPTPSEPDAGRRAARHAAPRRRHPAGRMALPRAGRIASGLPPRSRCSRSVLGDKPSGRLYKALVETQEGRVGRTAIPARCTTPATCCPGAKSAQDRSLDDARTTLLNASTSAGQAADHRRKKSTARATTLLKNIELDAELPERVGIQLSRMGRHGRLAPDFPPSRPRGKATRRGRAARRRQVPQAVEPHRRRVHSRRASPSAPRSRRRPTWRRCSRTTRATGRRRGRGVRPTPRTSKRATTVDCPTA